jgi:predicted double-glycine peptidase
MPPAASHLAAICCASVLVAACARPAEWHDQSVRSFYEARHASVVAQNWDLSCGAAALATILTYQHGDPVSERDVAAGMLRKTSAELVRQRLGFSLLDLKRYAESRGYDADGYGDLAVTDLLKFGPTIVPILVRGNSHFVIFRGMQGDRVLLADPAFGNRTMPLAEFESVWQGRLGFTVSRRDGVPPPNALAVGPADFWASSTDDRTEKLVRAELREDELAAQPADGERQVASSAPTPPEAPTGAAAAPLDPPHADVAASMVSQTETEAGASSAPTQRQSHDEPVVAAAAPARSRDGAAEAAAAHPPEATPSRAHILVPAQQTAVVAAGPASRLAPPLFAGTSLSTGGSFADGHTKTVATPEAAAEDLTAALRQRGEQSLAAGDIAAARLYLSRLSALGDAHAAFLVGETYDAAFLDSGQILGIRPDTEQALRWYRKAAAMGDADAQRRVERLTTAASS